MHVLNRTSTARIRTLLFFTLVISPECRVHGFLGGNGLGGIGGFGVIDTVIGIGNDFTESPSSHPSETPTFQPSAMPSTVPSLTPTLIPTTEPSEQPSVPPSTAPTLLPSLSPSKYPSDLPSRKPSVSPSRSPSLIPSTIPSSRPSTVPTWNPTSLPSEAPSDKPTNQPSSTPSLLPTALPTSYPSRTPSISPSVYHSDSPSDIPSLIPSTGPTFIPTQIPSLVPSAPPSSQPTETHSSSPSSQPTFSPSYQPTLLPSITRSLIPTELPTTSPSSRPTSSPTVLPSSSPTALPTIEPTFIPSQTPSKEPTLSPTLVPSSKPNTKPSMAPTLWDSNQPSSKPSTYPSISPTMSPLAFSFESIIIIANTDGILDDEETAAFERKNLVRGRHASCDIMSDVRLESLLIQSQGINVEDTFIVIRINTKGYFLTPKSFQNRNIVIQCVEDAYHYDTSEINKGASPEASVATAAPRLQRLTMILVAVLVCVLAAIVLFLFQRSWPRRRVTTEFNEAEYENSVVASVADLSYCDEDLLDIFALDAESQSLSPSGHGGFDKMPSTPDDTSNDVSQETSSVSNWRDMPSLFMESLVPSVASTSSDDKQPNSGASINIGSDEEEMIFYEQSSTSINTDEERPQRDGRSNIPLIMKELETMLQSRSTSGDGNTSQRGKRTMQRDASTPTTPPESKITPDITADNASTSADGESISVESSGIGNAYGLSLDRSLTSLQPDVFVQKLTDSQSVVSSATEVMQPGQLFSHSKVASLSPPEVKRADDYFSDASSASTFESELANRYFQRQREADEFSQSTGYTKSTYNPTSTAPNLDSIAKIDSLSHSSSEREEHAVVSDSPIRLFPNALASF